MSTIETDTTSHLLPTRAVCRRYGVSDRTVMRWKYWRESDLTNFDRARVAQR
jgi:hypothetical protein